MRSLPTGTVTLLFTDIEGSTRLLRQLRERYADLLTECRQLLRAAFQEYHGHEVDTQGDAFFVAFARATDAVSAAVTAQRALANYAWPEGVTVRVRMGLHTGEPFLGPEGYIGLDVHHAARIMSTGHGGQVLLSQTTRDLVEHELPDEMSLRDLGEHRLKDIGRPSRLYQLVISSLPADFPPLKTLDMHLNNLPIQLTPLIGREKEVAAIGLLLQREDVRLVTLTGTGGTGKTRLGLQVAAELSDHFADGVFFVALAAISDPELVMPTIARELGIQGGGTEPIVEQVKVVLLNKHLLLLLDNFEQVVTAASQIEELLVVCPSVKIIVTSRAVLHLQAEHLFPVPALALPDLKILEESAGLSQYSAVTLFVQRAQAMLPTFRSAPADIQAIAEICVRLDGLPLALELAAARIRLLPPRALLARLSQRFQILTSGARTLPERQQTLRNTLQWSYNLLNAQEQRLFRRLSVFVGGFNLEGAEAVCSATEDSTSVLDRIASLLDKSLLQQVEQEAGEEQEPRFQMLVTVREYGLDCLRESGEAEVIERAHTLYYLQFSEEAEPLLKGTQQRAWITRLGQEQENLRAALQWLIEHNEGELALRLCEALYYFWFLHGDWSEGRRWFESVLGLPSAQGSTVTRAKALGSAGELTYRQDDSVATRRLLEESITISRALGNDRILAGPIGRLGVLLLLLKDPAAGRPLAEESVALCRTLGLHWELCRLLPHLGWAAYLEGEHVQGAMLLQECVTLARELGDESLLGSALNQGGWLAFDKGDYVQAVILLQESLALAREMDNKSGIANALDTLGNIAITQGDLVQATALFTEGVSLGQQLGDKLVITWHLIGLGKVAAARGQAQQAARLFAKAEMLYRKLDVIQSPVERADYERAVSMARIQLGEKAFAAAWAEGRTMTPEQAVAAVDTTP